MLRKILATIAGIITAMLVILLVETAGHYLYPLPVDFMNLPHAAQEQIFKSQPDAAFAVILSGWIMASLACGFVNGAISRKRQMSGSFLAGLLLTTAGIVNVFTIWHPMWMIVSAFVVFIPMTIAGHQLANRFFRLQD